LKGSEAGTVAPPAGYVQPQPVRFSAHLCCPRDWAFYLIALGIDGEIHFRNRASLIQKQLRDQNDLKIAELNLENTKLRRGIATTFRDVLWPPGTRMERTTVAGAKTVLDRQFLSYQSEAGIHDRDITGSVRPASRTVFLYTFTDSQESATSPGQAERIMVNNILNLVTAFTA